LKIDLTAAKWREISLNLRPAVRTIQYRHNMR